MKKTLGWKRKPRRTPRTKASILIRDLDMKPLFILDIYGRERRDLMICPGGGNVVAEALEKRGIDPSTVMFTFWDVLL